MFHFKEKLIAEKLLEFENEKHKKKAKKVPCQKNLIPQKSKYINIDIN